MALRLPMLKRAGSAYGLSRWPHSAAISPPLSSAIVSPAAAPPAVIPETDRNTLIGFGFPGFSFIGGGSMELMAVPKKKTSPHKRGIRNGPKALKPVPVIVRCKACGRVKLQHFFCCSGNREHTGDQNN